MSEPPPLGERATHDEANVVRAPGRGVRLVAWLAAFTGVAAVLGALASRVGPGPDDAVLTSTTVAPPATDRPPRVELGPGGLGRGPRRPLGVDTNIVLYFAPAGGAPDRLVRYDVDHGNAAEVDLGGDAGWYVRVVAAGGGAVLDGGLVVRVVDGFSELLDGELPNGYRDAPEGRVAARADGGLWLRRFEPSRLDRFDAAGSLVASVPVPLDVDLYGTDANGEAVLRRPDGTNAVTAGDAMQDGDATLQPQGGAPLAPVVAGRYAERVCDQQGTCRIVGHLGVGPGQVIDLGPPQDGEGAVRRFRFQPNGALVAIAEDGGLTLADPTIGLQRRIALPGAMPLDAGAPRPSELTAVQFLPGSAGMAVVTDAGVVLVDGNGSARGVIPLTPPDIPGGMVGGPPAGPGWTPLLLGVGIEPG